MNDTKPIVSFVQRKPRRHGNFSLEFIFEDIRRRLENEIRSKIIVSPFESNGFFRRVAIACNARIRSEGVVHITGDINYAGIATASSRTILTVLDCGFLNRPKSLKRSLIKMLWLDIPVKRAQIITTISGFIKDEIIHYTNCDHRKIVVIPVAISESFKLKPKRFHFEKPRILQIGTTQNKNIDRVVDSLQGVSCTLIVIGKLSDEQLQKMRKLKIDFENRENLTNDCLLEEYQKCDIVSFPSIYEGFGMPILEAQAVGRPVVTSNTSSMPYVAGENAAVFVDPMSVESIRDGFLRVMNNTELVSSLIENGSKNVLRFDGGRIAKQYLQLYRAFHG